MPKKKSKNSEDEKPINLRRSPRLQRAYQINARSPSTPKNAETRSAHPNSFSTPLTKIKKTRQRVSRKESGKDSESNSEKSRNGCRRSARRKHGTNFSCSDLEKRYARENRKTRSSIGGRELVEGVKKPLEGSRTLRRRDRGGNAGRSDDILRLDKECVMEKRVTRSSLRGNKVAIQDLGDDFCNRVVNLTKEREAKIGADDLKKNLGEIERRVARSSSKSHVKKKACNARNTRKKAVILDEIEAKESDELSKIDKSKRDCGILRGKEESIARKVKIGEKRKRDQVEGGCEAAHGWSKEQEIALQRAYFTAKPTPQFWKKVSRMVPGKSAEECFDRIHSNHLTPPQPRTRSRVKITEPSPLSFSASKLLQPTELNSKRLGFRRRTLLAQKTVRQILQNQQKEDQDYAADLFSVLEPSVNPSPLEGSKSSFVSPKPNKSCPVFKKIPSSSSSRKTLSRFDSLQKGAITSPPVLKQIKNKALHEKYIDQLHCRDARRKAEALRKARNDKGGVHVKRDLVEVARNALVCDAEDAISKFRSLQSRVDEEDTLSDGDEEDDDDGV